MTQTGRQVAARESLSSTVQRLQAQQKSPKGAPAYSRFVNRPLGGLIAALAHRLGLSPNGVTAISASLSLTAIVVILVGGPSTPASVLVAPLLVLGYAFDSADGQLARLTGGGSPAGEWLDHVVDCAKISLLHLSVFLGLVQSGLSRTWLLLPLAYVVVANLLFFTYVLTDLLTRHSDGPAPSRADPAPLWRSVLVLPMDYGALCVAFAFWPWPSVFIIVYALLLLGTAGYLTLGLPKWLRDMKRVAPSGGSL